MAEMNKPITRQPIARPSGLALGLGIAGQFTEAYKDYRNYGGGMNPERRKSVLQIPN